MLPPSRGAGNADAKHNLKIPQMVAAAQQPAPMKTQPQPQPQQPQPQPQQPVPSTRSTKLEDAKESCILIGFKPGTEKLGDCVLKLLK